VPVQLKINTQTADVQSIKINVHIIQRVTNIYFIKTSFNIIIPPIENVRMKGIQNKIIMSQKAFIIHIYGLHHYKSKISKFFSDYITFSINLGCAVVQSVSRWLPTPAAWVRVRAAFGVCGGKSGTGAGLL
jgi:hypothetical protein